jgi:hypothetical protein
MEVEDISAPTFDPRFSAVIRSLHDVAIFRHLITVIQVPMKEQKENDLLVFIRYTVTMIVTDPSSKNNFISILVFNKNHFIPRLWEMIQSSRLLRETQSKHRSISAILTGTLLDS